MPSFNLLDDPWIPIVTAAAATPLVSMSLRDAVLQAHQLTAIDAPSPLTTAAVQRLVCAFLHRALAGPTDQAQWERLAAAGQFPADRIDAYCARWHDRFNLFDLEYPFYQSPRLDCKSQKPITQLTFSRASDRNRLLLFDHSDLSTRLTPDEAILGLITTQCYATGGFVSYDDLAHKSAKAAPLVNVGIWQRSGPTLFATLLANLLPYVASDDDRPVWEQEPAQSVRERAPQGRCDWYTYPSRRILLTCDEQDQISHVTTMKGDYLPLEAKPWHDDPQVILDEEGVPLSPRGHSAAIDLGMALELSPLLRDQTTETRLIVTWVLTQQVKYMSWHSAYLVVPAILLHDRETWVAVLLEARAAALTLTPLLDGRPVTLSTGIRESPMRTLTRLVPQRALEATSAPVRYWALIETQYRAWIAAIVEGHLTVETAPAAWENMLHHAATQAYAGSLNQIPNAPRRTEEIDALREQFASLLNLVLKGPQ